MSIALFIRSSKFLLMLGSCWSSDIVVDVLTLEDWDNDVCSAASVSSRHFAANSYCVCSSSCCFFLINCYCWICWILCLWWAVAGPHALGHFVDVRGWGKTMGWWEGCVVDVHGGGEAQIIDVGCFTNVWQCLAISHKTCRSEDRSLTKPLVDRLATSL